MASGEHIPRESLRVFDKPSELNRFPKDCVDLAFDYAHKRYTDLDLRDISMAYDCHGCMNIELRERLCTLIKVEGTCTSRVT